MHTMTTRNLTMTLIAIDGRIDNLHRVLGQYLGCRSVTQLLEREMQDLRLKRHSVLLQRDGGC